MRPARRRGGRLRDVVPPASPGGLNFAFRATASWSAAEDLTQATFTALWRRACAGTVDELVVWSGLDLRECAHVLGVPVGTVKSRLSRARHKLATTEVAALLGGEE